jgi:hypothetical protein
MLMRKTRFLKKVTWDIGKILKTNRATLLHMRLGCQVKLKRQFWFHEMKSQKERFAGALGTKLLGE